MLKLYKIEFHFYKSDRGMIQPAIVSAPNRAFALKRARAFVRSHYDETIVHDYTGEICRTPDDVLDWS